MQYWIDAVSREWGMAEAEAAADSLTAYQALQDPSSEDSNSSIELGPRLR